MTAKAHQSQPSLFRGMAPRVITTRDRARVIELMIQTGYTLKITDTALVMGIYMMDKVQQEMALQKSDPAIAHFLNKPFLVGAQCIYMASKMEDLRYPALSDFKRYLRNEFENLGISSELSDYKALRTESLITNILEYRFN